MQTAIATLSDQLHLKDFFQMELVRTVARNKIGYDRRSGMAVLAIERQIMMNLDRTVKHFNGRWELMNFITIMVNVFIFMYTNIF